MPVAMSGLVDQKTFDELMRLRSTILLSLAQKTVGEGPEEFVLTRPLLGIIQAESTQLEELLDSYNAKANSTWYPFRMHVAALKNFSTAGYELVHLRDASINYEFHARRETFRSDTENALHYVAAFIFCSLEKLLKQGAVLGWPPPEENYGFVFTEELPEGRLPRTRNVSGHGAGTAQERVIKLATSFLNNTEDARFLRTASRAHGPKWKGLNFDQLNEMSIRAEEGKFHNLQSLYDTYISDSETESSDPGIPKLRGHISCVLHLLRVTTIFMHFYERHFRNNADVLFCNPQCALSGDWFFEVLTHYLTRYSYDFLESARDLCQHMLQKYAVVETMEIPAPSYFGFHVRPSALVAAIVSHYGSKVSMILDREYDAGESMSLFLANEWINQNKRDYAFERLDHMDISDLESEVKQGLRTKEEAVREIITRMAGDGIVRVLRYPIPVADIVSRHTGTLNEVVRAVIISLTAKRHLDLAVEVKVLFRGDIRVLNDIRILADNGYGENEYGANIPLPTELGYLASSRSM